jgi:hypothetical protein
LVLGTLRVSRDRQLSPRAFVTSNILIKNKT